MPGASPPAIIYGPSPLAARSALFFRKLEARLGEGAAAGIFFKGDDQCLAAAVVRDGRTAVVACIARPDRLEEFRKLFELVVGSLRTGPDAVAEAGEEVDVPTSDLV
jgi:hypothetical protein